MKYLSFALAASLLFASCTTTKPPTAAPPSDPVGTDAFTPDSTLAFRHVQLDSVSIERPRTFLDKVLHRTPKAYTVPVTHAQRAINIGRKSTVSLYYGPATVNTVGKNGQLAAGTGAVTSHIEKKAGPAVVASDSSVLNTVTGGGNLAAVYGDGNQLDLKATTQQPPDWRATLAKPFGVVLAGAFAVAVVGGGIYLLVLWRKKKAVENLV